MTKFHENVSQISQVTPKDRTTLMDGLDQSMSAVVVVVV